MVEMGYLHCGMVYQPVENQSLLHVHITAPGFHVDKKIVTRTYLYPGDSVTLNLTRLDNTVQALNIVFHSKCTM